LVIFLAGFSTFLLARTSLVQFSVQNNIPGYNFSVSGLAGNLFLYSQGYKADVKKITVIFTTEKQDGVQLILEDDTNPTSSMNAQWIGSSLKIWEQYNQNALISAMGNTKIRDYQINLDEDLYAYLCLVMDSTKPGRDGCYQKSNNYIEKLGKFPPIKLIGTAKKLSLKLVKEVLAGCVGTIPCGREITRYSCSGDSSVACVAILV